MLTTRRHWRFALVLFVVLCVVYNLPWIRHYPYLRHALSNASFWWSGASGDLGKYSRTLGVASTIYVASLKRRDDRRANMTALARRLDVDFTFYDAIDSHGSAVANILDHVRLYRQEDYERKVEKFTFPLARPTTPIDWTDPVSAPLNRTIPLTCSTWDHDLLEYNEGAMMDYQILNEGKIACWETHLHMLRHIADSGSRAWSTGRNSRIRASDVAIILEDDVDIEVDIRARLAAIWPQLPHQWDMVFFGWCWSGEWEHDAIFEYTPSWTNQTTYIRPSRSPQCTNAYAVSAPGAAKLLAYLEYPPFAYSRAIDHAYSHLIAMGHITSFSLTPQVVIQRKLDKSDIWTNWEPHWEENLYHGALEDWDGVS